MRHMREWVSKRPGVTTSLNLCRILRHYQKQGENLAMDNGGWVRIEHALRLLNARADKELEKPGFVHPQPRIKMCHILAVARYGEGNPYGRRGIPFRYQVAIIKEPNWMPEVDIRDDPLADPDPKADGDLARTGHPPWSIPLQYHCMKSLGTVPCHSGSDASKDILGRWRPKTRPGSRSGERARWTIPHLGCCQNDSGSSWTHSSLPALSMLLTIRRGAHFRRT